jgi:hypothetical protein
MPKWENPDLTNYASDGDSRRRHLILTDYLSSHGTRLRVPWAGWIFFAALLDNQGIWGLHDQDFVYNGRKLINPLDSAARIFQWGTKVCALEHIGMVYQRFTYDDHNHCLEDVQQVDRQN